MYYLNSRFYDAEVGRFISADTIDLVLASQTALTDKNLYAYCGNNPITRIDATGKVWETIFDVLSLGASIIEVAFNPADPFAWIGPGWRRSRFNSICNRCWRNYTNEWRAALAYGSTYKKKEILKAAISIYSDKPRLLGAAIYTIAKVQ